MRLEAFAVTRDIDQPCGCSSMVERQLPKRFHVAKYTSGIDVLIHGTLFVIHSDADAEAVQES